MFIFDIHTGLELANCIIIFDEAHNIEDISRSEMSCEIEEDTIISTVGQLNRIVKSQMGNLPHFKSFEVLFGELLKWVKSTNALLSGGNRRTSFSSGSGGTGDNVWQGKEILDVLYDACSVSKDTILVFEQHLNTMTEAQEDINLGMVMNEMAKPVNSLDGEDPQDEKAEEKVYQLSTASMSMI